MMYINLHSFAFRTDLFDRIVDRGIKLGEVRASEILGSLLDAIAYLHERQIVHRDLKVSSSACEVDGQECMVSLIIVFFKQHTHDSQLLVCFACFFSIILLMLCTGRTCHACRG